MTRRQTAALVLIVVGVGLYLVNAEFYQFDPETGLGITQERRGRETGLFLLGLASGLGLAGAKWFRRGPRAGSANLDSQNKTAEDNGEIERFRLNSREIAAILVGAGGIYLAGANTRPPLQLAQLWRDGGAIVMGVAAGLFLGGYLWFGDGGDERGRKTSNLGRPPGTTGPPLDQGDPEAAESDR